MTIEAVENREEAKANYGRIVSTFVDKTRFYKLKYNPTLVMLSL